MSGLREKTRLAELLPSELSAHVHAWLALAARNSNRQDWADYLVERCQLLVDPAKMCSQEPAFKELWQAGDSGAPAKAGE